MAIPTSIGCPALLDLLVAAASGRNVERDIIDLLRATMAMYST